MIAPVEISASDGEEVKGPDDQERREKRRQKEQTMIRELRKIRLKMKKDMETAGWTGMLTLVSLQLTRKIIEGIASIKTPNDFWPLFFGLGIVAAGGALAGSEAVGSAVAALNEKRVLETIVAKTLGDNTLSPEKVLEAYQDKDQNIS